MDDGQIVTELGRLEIVPLTERHLEGLRQLRNDPDVRGWFTDESVIDADSQRLWFESYCQAPDDIMWVAVAGATDVLGAIAVYRINHVARCAEFGRLMVDPLRAQGRGLGRTLSEYALAQARALGLRELRLVVKADNVRALALYESCGFRPVGSEAGVMTMVLDV